MNCFNYLKIMKKEIIVLAVAALFSAASCSLDDCETCPDGISQARITLAVNTGDGEMTKAPYISSEPYESKVSDVQVLVFDSKGRLNAYKSSASTEKISMTTTYGVKTVWAVVNGPDLKAVKTLDALTSTVLDLSANKVSGGKGFVMTGSAEVNVDKADVPASVDVSRLTARVAICNIINKLPEAYSEMTIESIVLANVVGNQNISGTAAISTWYNKAGREDGGNADSIIDGQDYTASCPELTFKKLGTEVLNGQKLENTYCFYSYPNNTATDVPGWTNPFSKRKTRLIVTARIAGEKYYYPVVMESLERNKAYTVNMTITALGSTDPDKKVDKGTVTTTVNVLPWNTGAEYTTTI